MYTLKEEVIVLLYLIMYGVYLFSTLDILNIVCKKINKKITSIFVQVIYWILQIYLTFIFSYHLMEGYVPIYFVIFIYIGYYIYTKFFKRYFLNIIKIIFKVLKKIIKLIIKLTKPLFYSITLYKKTKCFIKRELKIIKNTLSKEKK